MADNYVTNSASGGDTFAADEITSVKFPRVKLIHGADGTNDGDVSDSNPLPVDDAGGSLTVDNTHLTSLGGAVSGTEVQVDVVAALPAGTNAIGTLAANSGVDIGDVDVTSTIPGTGATNLGKAVDSAAGGTDTGVAALAVRDDSLTTLTPADGDYTPLRVSSTGALHVTGGGGGTEYNEDDATPNPIVGTASLMERDDALASLTPIEGDWAGMRCNARGALWVEHDTTTAIPVTDNGGTLTVDNGGTFATQATLQANSGVDIGDVDVTSVIPGTGATNLGKAEDSAHTTGDVGVLGLGVRNDGAASLSGADGDYSALQLDNLGLLRSNISGMQSPIGTNSTTTPLGSSATFTGTGEQNELSDVMVSCFADQSGTLFFDFSVDGTNWRTFPTAGFDVAANIHEFHIAVKGPRHFRVRLVNDASAQGTLQLYTYFGTFNKPNAPLNQALGDDSDAVTTKSVIAGQMAGGSYGNVGITNGGSLKINVEEIAEETPTMNTGNAAAGTQRVVLASDQPVVSIDDNGGALTVDNGGTFAVQSTLQTGSNLAGDVGLSGARTSGGTTLYKNIDVDESEDAVKATAGQVYWIHAVNLSSAVKYLKLYNATVATVVVGTTVPDLTFPIPTQGDTNGAGFVLAIPNGIAFSTAITVAATTGIADADSGAPGANEVVVNLGYA